MITLNANTDVPNGYSPKIDRKVRLITRSLKLTGMVIDRETLDALLGLGDGWTAKHLYNELGEPTHHFALTVLKSRQLQLTGTIRSMPDANGVFSSFKILKAEISDAYFELRPLGAVLECKLTWVGKRGEADDLEEVLLSGTTCQLEAEIDDGGQRDMFLEQSAGERQAEEATRAALAGFSRRPGQQPGAGA